MTFKVILGSSSIYRANLLKTINLPFKIIKPQIIEQAKASEKPTEMAIRLTKEKLIAIKQKLNQKKALRYFIITCDQVGFADNKILQKEKNFELAFKKLTSLKGKIAYFHSAISLFDSQTNQTKTKLGTTEVKFRNFSDLELEKYLLKEKPYDAVAAFKSETSGMLLCQYIKSSDPTAIIGLPMVSLNNLFLEFGVELLNM